MIWTIRGNRRAVLLATDFQFRRGPGRSRVPPTPSRSEALFFPTLSPGKNRFHRQLLWFRVSSDLVCYCKTLVHGLRPRLTRFSPRSVCFSRHFIASFPGSELAGFDSGDKYQLTVILWTSLAGLHQCWWSFTTEIY